MSNYKIMKRGLIYFLFLLFITCNIEVLHAQGSFGDRKYTKGKIINWIEKIFRGRTVRDRDTVINVLLQSRDDLSKTETTFNTLKKKSPDEKVEFEETAWANELIEEIKKTSREIDKLLDEASNLNPFSKKDKNLLTEISLRLTELINEKIKPFKRLRLQIENPKVLENDYSFAVGNFELSKNAKVDIGKFPEEWENEILIWKNYVDPNGINLYKNDKIQVRINIVGYADKQGKGSENERMEFNKKLSENHEL